MVFIRVNGVLHYPNIALQTKGKIVGAGTFGQVEVFKKNKLAVKSMFEDKHFRSELRMTLLSSHFASLAGAVVKQYIIQLKGFCMDEKKLVFKSYDCDLNGYHAVLDGVLDPDGCLECYKHMAGLIRAVDYLNIQCGLSHCDIKPANILVRVNRETKYIEEAVLADFSNGWLNPNSTIVNHSMGLTLNDNHVIIGQNPNYSDRFSSPIQSHPRFQSVDLIADILNGNSFYSKRETPSAETMLYLDLYCIGESVLQVIFSCLLNPHNNIMLFHMGSLDMHAAMDRGCVISLLSYRTMTKMSLTETLNKTIKKEHVKLRCESAAQVEKLLDNPEDRMCFRSNFKRYEMTMMSMMKQLIIPDHAELLYRLYLTLTDIDPKRRRCEYILHACD